MTTINVKAEARSACEMLAGSRATVEFALRAAVDALLPSIPRIASYHLYLCTRGPSTTRP